LAARTLNAFLAASVLSGAPHKSLIKEYLFIALMIVRLQVAGFEAWKSAFDEVEEVRREYGWKKHEVFQDATNPNTAVVVGHIESLDRARQYLADERVRSAVARSGVKGPPEAWFLNEVEEKNY
jgi:quinol monooxygenase YgiN